MVTGDARVGKTALVQTALSALRRQVVIGVDDAHLLDPASAAAIAHLMTAGLAFVVMTLRRDADVPELAVSLYKQGRAQRRELEGPPQAIIGSLIDEFVDGPVDGLSRRRLNDRVRGNPLALREILRGGGLHQQHGMWHFEPAFAVPEQLADLVWHRLQGLDPSTRAVLPLGSRASWSCPPSRSRQGTRWCAWACPPRSAPRIWNGWPSWPHSCEPRSRKT